MQNILIKLRSNSRAMLGIILVVCLFALGFAFTATIPAVNAGNPIVAEAATITSSNFRSALGTSGSISGNFELTSDITVSAGNGWTSTATYNGTFDGKGHTITVNGSITHESARNANNYVGFFFGQLGANAVIKNVHIVWNCSWNEKAYNNASSASYSGQGSTTTYLGIIAGSASNGSKIEETPILVSGKPIVLTELYPEICGVIVVAKGASDLKVRAALLCATQTFLNVTSDKIEILTMR